MIACLTASCELRAFDVMVEQTILFSFLCLPSKWTTVELVIYKKKNMCSKLLTPEFRLVWAASKENERRKSSRCHASITQFIVEMTHIIEMLPFFFWNASWCFF